MSNAAGEIADRFHLLALPQSLLGVHELCRTLLYAGFQSLVEIRQCYRRVAGFFFALAQSGIRRAPVIDVTEDDRNEILRAAFPVGRGRFQVSQRAILATSDELSWKRTAELFESRPAGLSPS